MSITVTWNNEDQTAVQITFERPWNWNEFEAAYTQMDNLFRSVPHQAHLIIDVRNGGFPPSGALTHFKRVTEMKHPNLGRIVFVGLPTFIRGTVDILSKLHGKTYEAPPFLFATSVEAAQKLLIPSEVQP